MLLNEAVDALAIKPDGVYVDGTFGRGGHSRAILDRLGPNGRLIAIDRDPRAIEAGELLATQDKRFSLHHAAMSELTDVLKVSRHRTDQDGAGRHLHGGFLSR